MPAKMSRFKQPSDAVTGAILEACNFEALTGPHGQGQDAQGKVGCAV